MARGRVGWRILCGASALSGLAAPARADPPGGPVGSSPPATYTLVDPTPDAMLADMSTDRPNHVNSPNTIDPGHVQIETGIVDLSQQWSGAGAGQTALAFGEVNIRLGLLSNVEANLAFTSFETGPSGRGFGDLVAGAKFTLWGGGGSDRTWATALALQPQVKFPTAGSGLGNGRTEATVNIPLAVNLPAGFHLGIEVSPGLVRNDRNSAYVGGWQESISIDRVLIAQADVYLEFWAQTNASGALPQETIDTGFTYPVGKNIVLDSGVFVGLNRAAPSLEYVAGASVRF